jgi:hypothetical protein
MKRPAVATLALAVGLVFSAGTMADGMTKKQYQFLGKNIETEYLAARKACKSLTENALDICIVKANGRMNVARAELEASYDPSTRNRYKAREASISANYAVAIEKCDDASDSAREACVKYAKSAKTHEIAIALLDYRDSKDDADVQEKTAEINAVSSGK